MILLWVALTRCMNLQGTRAPGRRQCWGHPQHTGGFIHPHGNSVRACMCVCTVLKSAVCLGAVMWGGCVQPTSSFQKPTFQGQGGLRQPPCGVTMNECIACGRGSSSKEQSFPCGPLLPPVLSLFLKSGVHEVLGSDFLFQPN